MTPAARVQAAIELLDQIIEAARSEGAPADRLIASYFKTRRYAGSKDRRAVRELVYAAIRACGPVPPSGRAAMLRLAQKDATVSPLFDGSTHGPDPVTEGEPVAAAGIAPDWLVERLVASGMSDTAIAALLDRAPLDVRVNSLKADRETIDLPERGEPLAASQALRFPSGTAVEQWPAWRAGLIEVQDHGSQIACMAVGAEPGETIVDLCAGAGGKTLALAAAMENRGTLLACDTDKRRLGNLPPRAERAGAGMVETRLLDPGRELEALADMQCSADAVLVDAPCSGTGTWRRKPEAKWRITPERLERFTQVQDRLLGIGASLVKPGGRLVFVTCSVLDEEGRARIDRFLDEHGQWTRKEIDLPLGTPHGAGTRLLPQRDGADGFFVACLEKPC